MSENKPALDPETVKACAREAEAYGSGIEPEKAGSEIHERAAQRIAARIRSLTSPQAGVGTEERCTHDTYTFKKGRHTAEDLAFLRASGFVETAAEIERLQGIEDTFARIKSSIDYRLNDYLCEMKPDYDDSITGFNEAWDVVRKVFSEKLPATPPSPAAVPDDVQDKVLEVLHSAKWFFEHPDEIFRLNEIGAFAPAAEAINARIRTAIEFLAAAPQAPVASSPDGWQPIETAPKDGKEILACWDAPTPEYKAIGVVMWSGPSNDGQWISCPGHWRKEPTHWMPLPPAPGTAAPQAPVAVEDDVIERARCIADDPAIAVGGPYRLIDALASTGLLASSAPLPPVAGADVVEQVADVLLESLGTQLGVLSPDLRDPKRECRYAARAIVRAGLASSNGAMALQDWTEEAAKELWEFVEGSRQEDISENHFAEIIARHAPSPASEKELVEELEAIAEGKGECSTCGKLAEGDGAGSTSCDCARPNWVPRDPKKVAADALAKHRGRA